MLVVVEVVLGVCVHGEGGVDAGLGVSDVVLVVALAHDGVEVIAVDEFD